MKRIMLFMTLMCILSAVSSAATVAYWRFEEGPAGAQVPKTTAGYTWEPSTADSSGNGNHLSVWDEGNAGYLYRDIVAYSPVPLTGAVNNFSVKNSGGGPAMWNNTLISWQPAQWTIEATFKLENGGFRAIVGRDSYGALTSGDNTDANLAALYFQAIPDNGLAIKFCDVSGYWHEAISATNAFTSFDFPSNNDGTGVPWYSMAAVSDGTILSLYLFNHDAPELGYQQIAQTDMTVANPGSPDTALTTGAGSGGDWTAGEITVGRGLFASGHVDRAYGFIDEVRISDTALTPDELLCGSGGDIKLMSPTNGAELISVVRADSDNDLVFEVVDPNIADVEVYFNEEATDPNATVLIKEILSVGTGVQTITLETELVSDLSFETDYVWKVIGYEPNLVIPANGNDIPVETSVWGFTTAPEAPVITLDPVAFIAVDAGEPNIVLTANGINGDFKWHKDGSPIDDAGGVYDGTETAQLEIFDVQLADEGYYTLKVSSILGEDESDPARVMIKRRTSYYNFEATTIVDSNSVFEDQEPAVNGYGGFHAVLMQDAASAGLPTVDDVNQLDPSMGNYLVLSNADHATDPNGQYLQIYPNVVDYGDMTISTWIHMKSYLGWSRIFDFGIDQNSNLFLTPDNGGGEAIFTIRAQDVDDDSLVTGWLSAGQWYYVAVTLSGDTGRLYVNGEMVAINTGMTTDPIDVGATVNYIGKSLWPDPEFDGLIDELKIYNYARSTNEIAQEYLAILGDWVCDVEGIASMTYDFNGDCKVDLGDFALFAVDWLNDNRIYPE